MSWRPALAFFVALSACPIVWAQAVPPSAVPAAPPSVPPRVPAGSASFCLLQVPTDDPARQRWINLGIVQYIEAMQNELRIAYGGGNFGAGHDLRLIYGSHEEALAQLDRMRQTAAACTGR